MQGNSENSKLNCTPRISCRKQLQPKQTKTGTLCSTSIMNSMNESIAHYEQKLSQFKNFLQSSINQNQNIRCKCNTTLSSSLRGLKERFGEFANEWKNQLPLICREFMQIVGKICKLYQQEVERLTGVNSKWEFSYQQLLKATSSTSTSFLAISQKIQSEYSKNMMKQSNSQPGTSVQQALRNRTQPSQNQHSRIKQHEITLMREQITELFDQESSFYDKQLAKQVKLKIHDNIDEVNSFRLKTSSDEQTNLTNVLNGTGKNSSNFSCKNSYENSRKNSGVLKEQFWNNLQHNVAAGTVKLNKTLQNGKQNISAATSKERLSMASQKRKEIREEEQKGRLSYASGSKLSELKKNLYKNKYGLQNRM